MFINLNNFRVEELGIFEIHPVHDSEKSRIKDVVVWFRECHTGEQITDNTWKEEIVSFPISAQLF